MTSRRLILTVLTAAALAPLAARALDDAGTARVLEFANAQLTATARSLNTGLSPSTTAADGTWNTVASTDAIGWTQGFFPGANWYLYDLTGDPAARVRAEQWTRALEGQKTDTQTHDLGFKLYLSFGHAWRATGDAYYRDVLLTAAQSLASRFDPAVGAIICCDWNSAWHRPVVIDTMINLELLLWGAANGGPASWRDMAVSHALKTLADLVRPDGSTYHVVDYSAAGAILSRGTLQGYADSSTWTRGQAWAIYGYTMVYRYTRDARMLEAARKVADSDLARLGTDPIPNWDFDAPTQHKDSSAAAIVASALFELGGFVSGADQERYLQAATRMLDVLASTDYLAKGSSSASILLHGVGDLPGGHAIDAGLVYGDYYFLEALARRPAAAPDGGSGDAGVPPPGDAGVPDAGPIEDAGGSTVSPGDRPQQPGGSGCATGGGTASAALALASLLLLRARSRKARM